MNTIAMTMAALARGDKQFRVSDHFSLAELTVSSSAEAAGLSNWPCEGAQPASVADVADNLCGLCEFVLEPLRAHYGAFAPTSVYRSVEVNKLVGGDLHSQHLIGQAADLRIAGIANAEIARWAVRNLEFDQIILEHPPKGWVHISWRRGALRKSAITITTDKQTLAGIHEA